VVPVGGGHRARAQHIPGQSSGKSLTTEMELFGLMIMINHYTPLPGQDLARATQALKKFGITVGRIARRMRKQIEPYARLYLEMKRGPSIGRKRRSRRARGRARERDKS